MMLDRCLAQMARRAQPVACGELQGPSNGLMHNGLVFFLCTPTFLNLACCFRNDPLLQQSQLLTTGVSSLRGCNMWKLQLSWRQRWQHSRTA